MKNNDHGFTLVELIVSIAILGVIAVAAAGFLLAGTRSYTNVNYAVRLQYESQLAMSQIQNYVIDCSYGIAWGTKSANDTAGNNDLYIVNNTSEAGSYNVYVFKLDGDKLMLASGTKAAFPADKFEIVADNVTNFTVTAVPTDGKVKSINITLTMSMGKKTYEATQTIALRNNPVYSGTYDGLFPTT